jgi:hypothetical protein
MRKALVLSFAVHAALFGVARPLALRHARAATAPDPAEAVDRFAGVTAELPFGGPSGAVYDVSVDPSPPAPPPADPPPAVAPSPAPVEAPSPDAPAPSAPSAAPRASATAASTAASAPPRRRKPRSDDSGAEQGASHPSPSPARHGGGSGGPFGAEGPSNVRSFGRAFTHTIPLACSTDPVWAQAPLGDAGKLEVVVHVDAAGHVSGAEPRGASPPKALVSLVRRTMVLLEASTFAVHGGEVGEGTEILEIRAAVSQVAVDPSSEGGPLSLDNHEPGTAGFTQANGRHVEVKVRVLKVEGR